MDAFRAYSFDKPLLLAVLLLLTLGLIMVFSASGVLAGEKYGRPLFFLVQQAEAAAAGLVLIGVMVSIRRPVYESTAVVLGLLVLCFVLLVACFAMPVIAGVNRWVVFGGLRFQPSELAKIAIVLFLAWYVDRKRDRIHEIRVLAVPAGVILLFFLLIVKEPDFGTAVLLCLIGGLMLFLGGVRAKVFLALAGAAVPIFLYFVFSASYRLARVLAFASPDKFQDTLNFQVAQSKLAVGAGGILGASIGESVQKMFFIPYAHTDFIFAIIGEETGLLGGILTLGLFGLLVWRGLVISRRAPGLFSRLAAAGLTLMLAVQALFNFTVVLGLGPTKGVPLPFISAGRSSLVCSLLAAGILLHISQRRGDSRLST